MSSRFLTPSTITLLALIAMFCDDYVPSAGHMAVLKFISTQLLPPRVGRRKAAESAPRSIVTTLHDLEKALRPFQKAECEYTLWAEFCHIIWRIGSLDSMFDFFKSLPALFDVRDKHSPEDEHTTLSSTSLWGTFVRRSVLEFERLNFENAVQLWQKFERFRAPTASVKKRAMFNQTDLEAFTYVDELDLGSNHEISAILARDFDKPDEILGDASSADIEKLLTFQVDRLQSLGNRLPDEVRGQLQAILRSSYDQSSLSRYATFLDAWCSGDYPTSFEFLHRYYNYAMHNKDRSQYQYALLNMAILQADFGSHHEAVAAMHETIATARENKDMPCLNFSLSWLYHFRTVYGCDVKSLSDQALLGPSATSLSFLKAKAYESSMWSIASSTLLSEARLSLSQGLRPRVAFEKIYEASYLNRRHTIRGCQGAQMLTQASIYSRLGIASLSTAYAGALVDGYQRELRAEDLLQARCLIAQNCALAGDYAGATKVLTITKPDTSRNIQLHQLLSYQTATIKLRRTLHHNDLNTSELLLSVLKASTHTDPSLCFQILLLELDYLKRRKGYAEAFQLLKTFSEREVSESTYPVVLDVHHRTRLLSAKAILFAICGKPQKGLSLALRATIASIQAKILPVLWEAVAALAGVLISIGEPEAAERILDSCVWQAAETEDLALMAMLQSAYADTAIAIAGKARHKPHECQTAMRRALAWVQRAYKSYDTLEDILGKREMAAKASAVLKLLGDAAGAEQQMKLHHTLGENQFAV